MTEKSEEGTVPLPSRMVQKSKTQKEIRHEMYEGGRRDDGNDSAIKTETDRPLSVPM